MTAHVARDGRSRSAGARSSDPGVPLVVFDLASVETYFLAQPLGALSLRSEGMLWCPLASPAAALDVDRVAALEYARKLGLPLVWPVGHPAGVGRAMRVATLACARGYASFYVFGMTRLAFGGGADLDDPGEYLLAAEECGLDDAEVRAAAGEDSVFDRELVSAAGELARLGIDRAPVLRWEGATYTGVAEIAPVLGAILDRDLLLPVG